MANNSTPDVYLLLGVEGGSNIGKGSGLLISTQLKQIMEQVEETITSHLKIKLDQNALNDLKTQINSTVTEALTSIKGTPVELSFSFDQKSINAAFSKVKKEMKEQQLVFSSQPKEKKETGKSGTPASTGNVSKEAAEAKQAINAVGKEIENTTKEAEQALDNIIKKSEEAAKKVGQTVVRFTTGISGLLERSFTTLDPIKEYINKSKYPKSKQDGYVINLKSFSKYMDDNHPDEYGWEAYKYDANSENSAEVEKRNQKILEWINKQYSSYEDLFEFVENKDKQVTGIRIKNQEALSKEIDELDKRAKERFDMQEAYNEAITQTAQYFNLSKGPEGYAVTAEQLLDLSNKFPGIIEKLQISKDQAGIGNSFFGTENLIELVEQARRAASDVKPALDSTEKEFDDVTKSEKEAVEAGELLVQTAADVQYALTKYKSSFDVSQFTYFPGSAESFKESVVGNQILSQAHMKAASQALSRNVTPMLMLPEISTATADRLKKEEEEARNDADAHKELNEELEKGITLRERSLRLSSAISESPTGKIHTTTSRGLETGRIYTDTTKTTIGKDGEEQITTSYKFSNAQVNSSLDSALTKISSLQKAMNSLYDLGGNQLTTGSLIQPIIKSIEDVQKLIDAVSKATNHGYFGDLKDLGFEDVKSAQDAIQEGLKNINSQISNTKRLISEDINETKKQLDLLDKAGYKIEKLRSDFIELGKADVTNVTEDIRHGISGAVDDVELLQLALKDAVNGDNSLLKEFGIDDIDTGMRILQDRISGIDSAIKDGSNTVTSTFNTSSRLLDQASEKTEQLRHDFNQLSENDVSNAATNIKENITRDIIAVNQLIDALRSASETGDFTALQRVDINNFAEGYQAIRTLFTDINDRMREGNTIIRESEAGWNRVEAAVGRVSAMQKEWNDMSGTEFSDAVSNNRNIQERIDNINRLITIIREYRDLTQEQQANYNWAGLGVQGVNNLADAMGTLDTWLVETNSEIREFKTNARNINTSSIVSQMEILQKSVNEFDNAPKKGGDNRFTIYRRQASELLSIYQRYNVAINSGDVRSSQEALTQLQERYTAITTAVSNLTKAISTLSEEHREEYNAITQRNKIYQEAEAYYKKYQSGIRANITLNHQWLELMKKINTGGFTEEGEARAALASLQTATKEANAETMTLWGSLKKLFTDHFGSVSATAAIGTLRNVLRSVYQNVLEIDKAMTELRKVTELDEVQYVSFGETAAEVARKVGGSIADTISSTADFARLGFNLPDSTALAEAAMIYKNVGDGIEDISEASESIISTIKAFSDIDAEDALSIIDKFNEVGNNYAISSQGIGVALQKSAAALASANNSLDESIALITAGNSVVQNPEIIGTTLKTISMFLRASKTEAEEAGIETEGMANSVSKLRKEILALANVDIMKDNKTYKSTYQILKEISEVWEDISDVSQANILEKLGGKRNANVVASIIENFDVAEQALVTSMNSLGSATEENEKYLNSIEGHINKLKVSFEELSESVINSDLVKGGVDFLTNILNLLNGIVDVFGSWSIPAAIASVAVFNSGQIGLSTAVEDGQRLFTILGKTRGQWKELHESIKRDGGNALTTFGTAITDRIKSYFGYMSKADISKSQKQLEKFHEALIPIGQGFESSKNNAMAFYQSQLKGNGILANANAETQALALSLAQNIGNFNDAESAIENGNYAIRQFIIQQNNYTTATKLSTLAVNGFKIALSTFAPIAIITALSFIVEQLQKVTEEAKIARDEMISTAKEQANALTDIYTKLSEANSAYRQNQIDKDSYTQTTEDLIGQLRDEGIEVDNLIGKYNDLGEALEHLTLSQLSNKLEGVLEGVADKAANFRSKLGELVVFSDWGNADEIHNFSFLNLDTSKIAREHFTESQKGNTNNPYTSLFNVLSDWAYGKTGSREFRKYEELIKQIPNNFYTVAAAYNAGSATYDQYIAAGRDYYEQLKEIKDVIFSASANDKKILDTDFYKEIQSRLSVLSSTYNELSESISDYDQKLALVIVRSKKLDVELPETYQEYLKYRKDIYNSAISDQRFQGSQEERLQAIDNILLSDTDFRAYESKFQSLISFRNRLKDLSISDTDVQSIMDYAASIKDDELQILVTLDDSKLKSDFEEIKGQVEKEKMTIQLEALKTDGSINLSEPLDEISKIQGKLKPIYDEIANRQGKVQLTIDQTTTLVDTFGDSILERFDKVDGRIVVASEDLESFFEAFRNSKAKDVFTLIEQVDKYIKTLDEGYKDGKITEEDYKSQLKEYEIIKSILQVRAEYINQIKLSSNAIDKYNNVLEYTATLNSSLSNYELAKKLLGEYKENDSEWIADFDKQARELVAAYSDNQDIATAYYKWQNGYSEDRAKEFVEIWKQAYDKDVSNFNEYQRIRRDLLTEYSSDDEAWSKFLGANKSFVDELKKDYDLDLTNCKNWLELRNELINNKFIKDYTGIDIDKIQSESAKNAIRKEVENWKLTGTIADKYNAFLRGEYNVEPNNNGSAKVDSKTKEKDETDKKYKTQYKKLERERNERKRQNNESIKAEEEFIKKWRQLNKETYENTDVDKYEENLEEIEKYIEGLNDLLDEYLNKWGKLNDYDEKNIGSRQSYLIESQRVNYETYGDPNSTFYNLDTYEKNLADQAKYEADTLKTSFDRGLTSYEDYMSGIRDIRKKYKDRDGNYLLDMSFVSGYEDVDKSYNEQLEALQKANDKSLDAERQYISDWNALNDKLYKGIDVNKYESNRKSIAESELKLLERMYTEGYITAKEYFDKVTALWNENSDILGKDTQYDWLEEAWSKRTADEKLYWEQQKELATQYYDEEIKKLQEVKDEEEKISKAEELRLNLIKARQKLEEAKSQKNQLVFHDGTFEYMADQEAIMSAEEEVANALKEIKDNELQEQIKVLEDQRDEALLFYSNIIGMLDYYINGTRQIESSDPEVIEKAMASGSGNYFMRLMRGEITMDEVREELRKQFTKDETTTDSTVTDSRDKADVQNDSTINEITKVGGEVAGIVNSFAGFVDNMKSLDIGGLFNLATSLMNKVSKDDTIGFVGTSTSEDISNAINNVYNNSNVSNDNSVNVGDIHMTIQGGTSEEMLNQFANKLGSAISTIVPKAVTAH